MIGSRLNKSVNCRIRAEWNKLQFNRDTNCTINWKLAVEFRIWMVIQLIEQNNYF